MKKTLRLLSLMLTLALTLSLFATIPASAAYGGKTDPYGYTWLDENEDIWYFQYYKYSSRDGYTITDYAYLDGSKLYDSKGKLILANIMSMDNDSDEATQPTVAYFNGKLYFITKSGEVCQMDKSTDTKYKKTTNVSNAKYFVLDADDLATKVYTSYTSSNINSLSFTGSYSRNSSSSNTGSNSGSNKSGNYVLTYAYNGDPTKTAYDAYYDDELLISIYCKGSNVWVETEDLLLSESCVGAKFVGYSSDYLTILYDLDGTIFCYPYNDFDTALPISLGEELMSYKKDSDGFIESITTSRRTYDLEDLLEDYGYDEYWDEDEWDDDWDDDDDDEIYDNIKYVTRTTSYAKAYKNNSTLLATIKKSSNYLYYEDIKLEESYKATYFSFTEEGYPVWINNSGELWYYNGSREKQLDDDVTLIQYDSDGFAYKYKAGNKTYSFDF